MRWEVEAMDNFTTIETKDLTKKFKDLVAVDDLSLTVRKGEIFGFLGPNGAGKTTTIRLILGLTYPTKGSVLFNGVDISDGGYEIRRNTGFLPERIGFYNNLTARQTMEFYSDMKGKPRREIDTLLGRVGLWEFANKKVGTFSRGMVQLLGIAQAFIGNPRILILDEPAGGLDPRWIREVKNLIRESKDRGATVFFSSHILGEVEKICDRVAIISRGRLVAEDTVKNLSRNLEMKPRLWLQLGKVDQNAISIAKAIDGVTEAQLTDDWIMVECEHEKRGTVMTALQSAGYIFMDVRTEEPSLEDMFLKITGEPEGVR